MKRKKINSTTTTTKKVNKTPHTTTAKPKRSNTSSSITKTKSKTTPKTSLTSTTKNNKKRDNQSINHDYEYKNLDDGDGDDDAVNISSEQEEVDYFTFKSDINKTSNNTLAQLKILDDDQINRLKLKNSVIHKKEKELLFQKMADRLYYEMYCDLKSGNNVLVYGYGSKKSFLESFVKSPRCSDGVCFPIYGYLPNFRIKDVLDGITNHLFKCKSPNFSSLMMQCYYIKNCFEEKSKVDQLEHEAFQKRYLKQQNEREQRIRTRKQTHTIAYQKKIMKQKQQQKKQKQLNHHRHQNLQQIEVDREDDEKYDDDDDDNYDDYDFEDDTRDQTFDDYSCLYLLIHNIDGVSLRNIKTQTILAFLSTIPQIHIIASIDHLNSSTLWDLKTEEQFNWIRHSVPTYQAYSHECNYEVSLINHKSTSGHHIAFIKSIIIVLRALPLNSRLVFQTMVEYFIRNHSSTIANGGTEMTTNTNMQSTTTTNTTTTTKGKSAAALQKQNTISLDQLYTLCFDQFLVSSLSMLKSLLPEFIDHHIIHSTIENGENYLSLPKHVDLSSLLSLLKDIKDLNLELT